MLKILQVNNKATRTKSTNASLVYFLLTLDIFSVPIAHFEKVDTDLKQVKVTLNMSRFDKKDTGVAFIDLFLVSLLLTWSMLNVTFSILTLCVSC